MSALAPVDAATIIAARQFIAERVSPEARGQYLSGRHDHFAVIQACAAAILAERERAAQICDKEAAAMQRAADFHRPPRVDYDESAAELHDQGAAVASRLADAIRNPHLPSGAAACAADTAGATLLPAPAGQFESDAATTRPEFNRPATENRSAQERSSDRSGGQFGDAPKPAHIPGEVAI